MGNSQFKYNHNILYSKEKLLYIKTVIYITFQLFDADGQHFRHVRLDYSSIFFFIFVKKNNDFNVISYRTFYIYAPGFNIFVGKIVIFFKRQLKCKYYRYFGIVVIYCFSKGLCCQHLKYLLKDFKINEDLIIMTIVKKLNRKKKSIA